MTDICAYHEAGGAVDDLAESGKKVKYNCLDSSYSIMPVTIESPQSEAHCLWSFWQTLEAALGSLPWREFIHVYTSSRGCP